MSAFFAQPGSGRCTLIIFVIGSRSAAWSVRYVKHPTVSQTIASEHCNFRQLQRVRDLSTAIVRWNGKACMALVHVLHALLRDETRQ